jgi:hypothetical protein
MQPQPAVTWLHIVIEARGQCVVKHVMNYRVSDVAVLASAVTKRKPLAPNQLLSFSSDIDLCPPDPSSLPTSLVQHLTALSPQITALPHYIRRYQSQATHRRAFTQSRSQSEARAQAARQRHSARRISGGGEGCHSVKGTVVATLTHRLSYCPRQRLFNTIQKTSTCHCVCFWLLQRLQLSLYHTLFASHSAHIIPPYL